MKTWFKDGNLYVVVETGMPETTARIRVGAGPLPVDAVKSLQDTGMQCVGRTPVKAALSWAYNAGLVSKYANLAAVDDPFTVDEFTVQSTSVRASSQVEGGVLIEFRLTAGANRLDGAAIVVEHPINDDEHLLILDDAFEDALEFFAKADQERFEAEIERVCIGVVQKYLAELAGIQKETPSDVDTLS